MIDWRNAKNRTDVLVPWLTLMAVIAGGGYTLVEYIGGQRDKRIEATLGYVSRFSTPPLSEARARLVSAWDMHEGEILAVLKQTDVPSQIRARKYEQLLRDVVTGEGLSQPAQEVFLFFEQLSRCVKLDVCDAETARELLASQAEQYFHQYYPYVCLVRSQWSDPSFAADLAWFINPESPAEDFCVEEVTVNAQDKR